MNTNPPTAEAVAALRDVPPTRMLAVGRWTDDASPERRRPVMPYEARETMALYQSGKIDQWFSRSDGQGPVFLLNETDAAKALALLEALPLGQAKMMVFDLIQIGPLWPLALLSRD